MLTPELDNALTDLRTGVALLRELLPEELLSTAVECIRANAPDDPTKPLGRGGASAIAIQALQMHALEGVDPVAVVDVYADAIRLHGTPAESAVPIAHRLAALPRPPVPTTTEGTESE